MCVMCSAWLVAYGRKAHVTQERDGYCSTHAPREFSCDSKRFAIILLLAVADWRENTYNDVP